MKRNQVAISVIVPVYNVEKYVEECLDSILKQTFSDYEIICVEDASSDDSYNLIRKYEKQHKEIKVIQHTTNRGLSAARNTGMQEAEGKYILFVDSDDKLAHNNVLEELFFNAEKYETEMLYFDFERRNDDNMKSFIPTAHKAEEYSVFEGRELFCNMMEAHKVGVEAWRVLFKKEFLMHNRLLFVEGLLHEDILFSFHCIMLVKRIVWIKEIYYLYRQREGSISNVKNKKREESLYFILSKLYAYWSLNQFTERENEAIAYFFKIAYNQYQQYRLFSGVDEKEPNYYSFAEKYIQNLVRKDSKIYLDAKKVAVIAEAESVIVYGAGVIAQNVIRFLQTMKVKIDRIAVTNKANNPDYILDIPVSEISELVEYKKTGVVIVAVNEKNAKEIIPCVVRMGYKNIVELTY